MKYLIATIALAFTVNANAALIEAAYNSTNLGGVVQYNIDSDTGNYWLDFGQVVGGEQTFGATIDEAVDYYSVDGWRLATNDEVVELFYNQFPSFVGNSDGYTDDLLNTWNPELDAAWAEWKFSFGTYASSSYISSRGRYLDEDGIEQVLGVAYLNGVQYIQGPEYFKDLEDNTGYAGFGVMMIYDDGRGICNPQISDCGPPAVPIPAAAWLFASGLLGLVAVGRRKA